MTKLFSLAGLLCVTSVSMCQSLHKPATSENFRGLSLPTANVFWASGTRGTYVKTLDGGNSWMVAHVPEAESLDFRDVEAFSNDLAYLLAAGPGEQSRIYKTSDGGKKWVLQFTNKDPKGFYDCMAFWDKDHGIAVGDPVEGKFQLIKTDNGGKQWTPIPAASLPEAVEGEGAFAASGTCLVTQGRKNVWFGTGGAAARVFHSSDRGRSWTVSATPIAHNKASQGIFSLSFRDARHGIAVGGDYASPNAAADNIALTSDGGRTWISAKPATGSIYLSAVAYLAEREIVAVGTAGVMHSDDGGKAWRLTSGLGFNALAASTAYPDQFYLVAGTDGRIEKYRTFVEVAARQRTHESGMLR